MSVRIKKNIFGKCSVVYDCPNCRTVLRSSTDQIEKEDFCPVCDATFMVPGKLEFEQFLDHKRAAAEMKAQIRAAAKEKKVTKPHVLNVSAPVSVQGMSDSQTAPSRQPAFCSSCGTKLAVDGTFCSCCGKPLTVVLNPKSAAASGTNRDAFRTPLLAGLLVFFGTVGATYFYLFFDTSVSVPASEIFGQSFGGDRVNNIGLMAERQNGIIVSIAAIVIGFIIEVIARGRK